MKKAIPKKRCEYAPCNKAFRPARSFQKYCSVACKQGAWWARKMDTVRQAEVIVKQRAGL